MDVRPYGVKAMGREMNAEMCIELYGDSSAAKGTLARQGSGKMKHQGTKQLWLQEKIGKELITYTMIPRSRNHADTLTHHWTISKGERHFRNMNIMTKIS